MITLHDIEARIGRCRSALLKYNYNYLRGNQKAIKKYMKGLDKILKKINRLNK